MIAHSGIGTHIRGLLEGFRELAAPPRPLLLGPERLLRETPEAQGFDALAWDAPIYSIREQWSFPLAELRRRGVRAIHSPHYNIPLRSRGLRRLATIHDLIHLIFSESLSLPARAYAKAMLRRAARRADALFAVSEHTRADIERLLGVPAERAIIAYNAPGRQFRKRPSSEHVRHARERLGLPDEHLLAIGINKPHKNFRFLVEVCVRLQRDPETALPLVVAGVPKEESGPYLEAARAAGADRPERVLEFPGRVPWEDIAALYASAKLLVFPSLYEGFGLPVVEAQSLGVPVACSNAASLPEVAGEDGAAFFDPRDADDATRVIGGLLRDPERLAELARRGEANARRFSWRATAQVVADAYARTLGQAGE